MPDADFNLLEEPWLVALTMDGRQEELSILGVLQRAGSLRTLGGEVPTQAFAHIRLLLAILHRALDGPRNKEDWAGLWEAQALPMDRISAYTNGFRHRFFLFHELTPFFQVADLRTAKGEVSGMEKIVADVPNGEPFFTTRSLAGLARVRPAEAARWLVHVHAFDPSGIKSGAVGDPTVKGGKGYPIGTGWSGQIGGVLPEGRNLRETLLLNLIAADLPDYLDMNREEDLPPWERDPDGAEWAEDRLPAGPVQLYTWQSRRVRLVGDRSGVTGVVLANGDRARPQNRQRVEPHTAWRYSEPQSRKFKQPTYMPLTHEPSRVFWRGLEALLPTAASTKGRGSEPARYIAPAVMQWLAELASEDYLPDDFIARTRAIGAVYGTQSATYAEIVDDAIPLALVLLREDDVAWGRLALSAVDDAAAAAGAVARLADEITQAAGGDPSSGSGAQAREQLFAALDSPYRSWLVSLRARPDRTAARAEWQNAIRAALRPIVSGLIEGAPPAAWVGREVSGRLLNVSRAEARFLAKIRTTLRLSAGGKETTTSEEVA